MKIYNTIKKIKNKSFIKSIINNGGEIYICGGFVRDLILNKKNKDIDLVIRLIPIDKLISILNKFGKVDVVGKSFGVIKFFPFEESVDYDISLPRTEIATGEGGHKGVEVSFNENLPIEKDLERRDAKINSMAINLNKEQFIDPFQGLKDVENKQMSMTNSEAFSDDPLRMLRMIGFASRFDFTIEPDTLRMIRQNAPRIKEIAPERILTEFDKFIQKGNPLVGATLLKDTGLLKNIFGVDKGILISNVWDGVKTMGEFIYLLSHNLVEDPAKFYKNELKGDISTFKEIQALTWAYKNVDESRPARNRYVANRIVGVWPEIVNSEVLPKPIEFAIDELKSGKYPLNTRELAANGHDFMNIGLRNDQIGKAQNKAMFAIYSDVIPNEKEAILKLVQSQAEVPNQEPLQESESKRTTKAEYGCLMIYPQIPNWDRIVSKIDPNDVYNYGDLGIENKPHVTILYGFEDSVEPDHFLPFLSGISEPIEIVINGLSHFENEEFDVVKLNCESSKLREIRKYVEQLPHIKTYPNYVPHMTLAYVKKGKGQKYDYKLQKPIIIKGTKLVYSNSNRKKVEMEVAQPIEPEKELL
jgi:tRNA nucleotidyltransferase/poly(A) polymerase/2'-5' RNA ligase